jgi:hypothetical protein
MMAVVILASAIALSTLSVGFGLWLFLWVVESNSPAVSASHATPQREKVAQRQPVKPPLGKQERTHMMDGVSVDPLQVFIRASE